MHGSLAGPNPTIRGTRRARYSSSNGLLDRSLLPSDRVAKPSSKGIFAFQPNSRRALEMSSMRRGWPSGLEVSQMISPSNRLQCCREGVRPQGEPCNNFAGSCLEGALPTSEGVAIVQHGPSAAFASTSLTLLGGIVEPSGREQLLLPWRYSGS